MSEYRIERDLLGKLEVPYNAYYGIQTFRAIQNFPLNGFRPIADYPELIESLIQIKKAAAIANYKVGIIDQNKERLITQACDYVLSKEMFDQFPIHSLHGGGGTSANMNANEVIANIANEIGGENLGTYKLVHPNEDVNINQSTNDVYPSACHLAVVKKWPRLKEKLEELIHTIHNKQDEFRNNKKISRTCLQDAVVIDYNDFFSGYSEMIKRSLVRIENAVNALIKLNIGGTIVGDRKTVTDGYIQNFIKEIREITGLNSLSITDNMFDAAQNPDDMANVSAQLNLLARSLVKVSKDIRLMSSGPQTGLGEIIIPEVQPGSSIMPGKVNPVIPEFLIQLCFQVIGKNATVQMLIDHGELELNIYESSLIFNILDQMDLLISGVTVFNTKCFSGIQINKEVNLKNTDTIIPLITELMHKRGYKFANAIFKEAGGNAKLIRKYLNEDI
ncbi:MAG: aspartate ammonia-lyase [Bacteroidetes bacterium]|nr:aspartate ammonia-lyase [Bacteroidota bacterium]